MVKKSSKKERDIETISKALKTNNQNYYNKLMSQYHNSVHFYVNDIIKNQTISNDLTIEIMGKAFINLKSYNFKYAFSTWIFTIARNKKIDAIRKQNRPEPEQLYPDQDYEPDQESVVELQQETERLTLALRELPEKQRVLVEKAYLGELSHSEIAEITGLPLGTIKSRIRLALEKLRHSMM